MSVLFAATLTLYIVLNLRNYGLYTGNHPFFPAQPCEYIDETQKEQLLNMTYHVHKILDSMQVDHWLMYGSIFGAVREHGPLPWDNDVDIGFNGGGKFSTINFDDFLRGFTARGLKVYHKRWITSNVLKVYRDDLPHIKVDLFAFYNYSGWMKRAGLETWVLALNYNLHDTFPAQLVKIPLPETRFGSFNMPVPRQGIEIQKYLYPHDWWKEVKPVTCS